MLQSAVVTSHRHYGTAPTDILADDGGFCHLPSQVTADDHALATELRLFTCLLCQALRVVITGQGESTVRPRDSRAGVGYGQESSGHQTVIPTAMTALHTRFIAQ